MIPRLHGKTPGSGRAPGYCFRLRHSGRLARDLDYRSAGDRGLLPGEPGERWTPTAFGDGSRRVHRHERAFHVYRTTYVNRWRGRSGAATRSVTHVCARRSAYICIAAARMHKCVYTTLRDYRAALATDRSAHFPHDVSFGLLGVARNSSRAEVVRARLSAPGLTEPTV